MELSNHQQTDFSSFVADLNTTDTTHSVKQELMWHHLDPRVPYMTEGTAYKIGTVAIIPVNDVPYKDTFLKQSLQHVNKHTKKFPFYIQL